MSLIRLTVLAAACAGASTAPLIACVGDDATPVVTEPTPDAGTTTPVDSGGSSTSSSGSSGTTEPDASTTEPDASTDAGVDAGDAGPTGSQECAAYCGKVENVCGFSTTDTDSYPSSAACLAICEQFPVPNATADSLTCRNTYLASTGAMDCRAAGPWGYDPDTSHICGSENVPEPCTSICRVLVPRCAAAGASVNDCSDFCLNLEMGGTVDDPCMEANTLAVYGAPSAADVVTYCNKFKACGQ